MEYTAYYTSTVSTTYTFEADSPQQAQDMADEFDNFPTICAQCSGWGKRRGIELSGDWEQPEAPEANA